MPQRAPFATREHECPPNEIAERTAAMQMLLKAHACSQELGEDPWQFAVEISSLWAADVTNTVMRWLICKGYVEHAQEKRCDQTRRTFCRSKSLHLSLASCFVLTSEGAALARAEPPVPMVPHLSCSPRWDAIRRELWLGDLVVKRFRQPAPNQERVISAFEEEGWPARVDDPLPPAPGQDAKRRLHITINNLNRSQENRLIRFAGGGDGESVRWEARARESRAKSARG